MIGLGATMETARLDSALDDRRLKRNVRVIWIALACLATFLTWAYFAPLDEVATGTGRVVPTSREQTIQSLDGGVLAKLLVEQDDIVQPGQIVAQLDPTRSASEVDESTAAFRAAEAKVARLEAEVSARPISFPDSLKDFPELRAAETRLYETRRQSLAQSLRLVDTSLSLIAEELQMARSLLDVGAASNVEVIRLRRELSDLELKKSEIRSEYMVQAREELANAREEVEKLAPIVRGRSFSLDTLTLRAPLRGIVKSLDVSTIGGVVPPGGQIMTIIPLDDQLLIEARIAPRDIAFIRPGQRATVKITAYDYAIYGGLEGKVATISPDTIQDETDPQIFYYRAFVRTTSDALVDGRGKRLRIVPGMVATVDIHTGSKTVMQYLMKPLNRAREALRER